MDFTFANLLTADGAINVYLGQGCITTDSVPDDFFCVAGVAQVANLEEVLL